MNHKTLGSYLNFLKGDLLRHGAGIAQPGEVYGDVMTLRLRDGSARTYAFKEVTATVN